MWLIFLLYFVFYYKSYKIKNQHRALEESLKLMESLAVDIDVSKDEEITKALTSCIGKNSFDFHQI